MNTQIFLAQLVDLFRNELGDNLIGVYLHGSMAMGCFHPKESDIDLLIIVKNGLHKQLARTIIDRSLELHDEMPYICSVEYSIVLQKYLSPFEYPTPFELHYSEVYRERYRTDRAYICGGFTDPDLAAHFMVAYHRGITLYGKPLHEICEPIPREYYIDSIYHDIKNAKQDVIEDPTFSRINHVDIVLNLCRVLFYLQEGKVSSKKEGGEWAVQSLPKEYQKLIQNCLQKYLGVKSDITIHQQHLLSFVDDMLQEIELLIRNID